MGSWGGLKIGPVEVTFFKNVIPHDLLALFQDSMYCTYKVPECDYYRNSAPKSILVDVFEYRASAFVLAQRLDLIGVDLAVSTDLLQRSIQNVRDLKREMYSPELFDPSTLSAQVRLELSTLGNMTVDSWFDAMGRALRNSASEPATSSADAPEATVGSAQWLFNIILDDDTIIDATHALRLLAHAAPDIDVVLDFTHLVHTGWIDDPLDVSPSASRKLLAAEASETSPVVVLTEGRTDAEFLSLGLRVLYPHLVDLIRFLDFDQKAEGGAPALVRLVRAFAAAGITNRVVAIFDNDAAAADALSAIKTESLSASIRIQRYPYNVLLEDYPTIGPPGPNSGSMSSLVSANINGLAASIELYLGNDVLTLPDGTLRPVQWSALLKSGYHGVITDKQEIHQAFRAKAEAVLNGSASSSPSSWDGLRSILDQIRTAFAA